MMTLQRQMTFWLIALIFFLAFLWLFRSILLPFIMGMALAYVMDPVADRLERIGMTRLWATISILLLAVILFVLFLVVLIPVLATQVSDFAENLPSYVARLQVLLGGLFDSRLGRLLGAEDVQTSVDSFVQQGAGLVGTLLKSLWAGGQAVLNIVSLFVVTPVVAFYLLYDWDRMIKAADGWLPRDHVETVRTIARQVDTVMAGFIRGQGTVCLLLGTFYAIGLTVVGLNFGLLIGMLAGVISFIPYVGTILGLVVAVGIAVVQFWPDWIWVVAVAGVFAVGQFFEGNILQPKLVGSSIGVHPVWLMFALFAFGLLFGFVGLLMAVPATAAIGVLVRFALGRYLASGVYSGRTGRQARALPMPDQSGDQDGSDKA